MSVFTRPEANVKLTRDSCPYLKDGNSNPKQLFCFKTEGATHVTDCREGGTTPGAPILYDSGFEILSFPFSQAYIIKQLI